MQRKRPGFSGIARTATEAVASPWAPLVAIVVVLGWLLGGPSLGVPDSRVASVHLAIGFVTLLIVFLLEHHEARNTRALHIKLDEILARLDADRNKVGIERLSEDKLKDIQETERRRLRAR